VGYNVLQCVAVRCSALQSTSYDTVSLPDACSPGKGVLQCVAVCCSLVYCVALCYSVMQCDTMSCSELQ